jgi:hypothetical protein
VDEETDVNMHGWWRQWRRSEPAGGTVEPDLAAVPRLRVTRGGALMAVGADGAVTPVAPLAYLGCPALVEIDQSPDDPRSAYVPAIRLDLADRPDIVDLVRVHDLDGDGEGIHTWFLLPAPEVAVPLLVLRYAWRRPARCEFWSVFEVERDWPVLDLIASSGRLFLPADPHAADMAVGDAPGLLLEVAGPELARLMAEGRRGLARRSA